jgi:DNA-binding CsgD family transcriptional regulator
MSFAVADVQRIVPLAYEAALDGTRWPHVLQTMLGLFDGHCGSFICRRPDGSGAQCVEVGFDPKALDDFFGYFASRNVLFARGRWHPAGAIVSDQDLLPKAEFRRTEYYNDLLLKQENTNAVLAAFLWRDPERLVVFNCNRSPQRPEFDNDDKARLRPLLSHLARAFDVALRLDSFRSGHADQLALLAAALPAVMVVGEAGNVLYANAAGERLLAEQDGLRAGPDGLVAATPRLTAALRLAMGRAATGEDGGSLQLARPRRGRPLYAVALPLPAETSWLQPDRRRVLLLLRDPAERPALSSARLRALFGLTAAEARMAVQLYHGVDLAEAADRLGISRHTARACLNAVLRKTETHRQAELIRRLTIIAELGVVQRRGD